MLPRGSYRFRLAIVRHRTKIMNVRRQSEACHYKC